MRCCCLAGHQAGESYAGALVWTDDGGLELTLFDEDRELVAQENTVNVLPGANVVVEQVTTGQQDGDVMISVDNVEVHEGAMNTADQGDNAWQTADGDDDDVIVAITFDPTLDGPEVLVSDGNGGITTTGGTVSPQGQL